MHQFKYVGANLCCESVDLGEVARLHGTPTYVYSAGTMEGNLRGLTAALEGLDARVCYAVKANSNLSVLRHFGNLGCGFDLVSGGELRRVLAAGMDVKTSVFAGVGKTEGEIALALEKGIFSFHVESEGELERINYVAGKMGVKAPVALRVNPDVDARTHAKISTGKSENKFGVPFVKARTVYEMMGKLEHVKARGVQMHIGSQILETAPFVEAVEKMLPLVEELRDDFGLEYFSVGGGLGIPYEDALESGSAEWWEGRGVISAEEYGKVMAPLLRGLGMKILVEPGRFLTGNAGVMLSKVEYLKKGDGKNFLILDAGFNDLVRPAMYESYHEIVPLNRDTTRAALKADVVGPVCETGDCFAKDRVLQAMGEGELVAFMSAGAYGFSMASRYNSRPLPAEVMVSGGSFEVVRERESFEEMVKGERVWESKK